MFNEAVDEIISTLRGIRIVPVLVLENIDHGMKMCEILSANGLKAAEVTFRTSAAESIIRKASAEFPDLLFGAGTILNVRDLHRAFDAGARFAVAPGFNPSVVKDAVKHGTPFMPGISCPTHVEQAMELSVKHFKYFPAEALGGVNMLKNIVAPYRHLGVSFIPTGGLNPGNVMNYFDIQEVSACGGTWLGKSSDMAAGAWDKIEATVRETVRMIS